MSVEDIKDISRLINEWNSSRYELFALSHPNEVGVFSLSCSRGFDCEEEFLVCRGSNSTA